MPMGQQEYNAFREQMSQWIVDNADVYDEFEEMMNSQSDIIEWLFYWDGHCNRAFGLNRITLQRYC